MSFLVAIGALILLGMFWRQVIVGMGFVLALGAAAGVLFGAFVLIVEVAYDIAGRPMDNPKPVSYVAPTAPSADPFVMAGAAQAGWKPHAAP